MSELYLAARGLDHAGWLGDYYPDDLPEEWRLDFYANRFTSLLLPEREWRSLDAAMLAEWVEESREDFRFFLEAREANAEALERIVAIMRERLAGLVLLGSEDSAQLASRFASRIPCAVYCEGEPSDELRSQLSGQEVTLCWQDGDWHAQGQGLRVAYCKGTLELKALRALIEAMAREEGPSLLVFAAADGTGAPDMASLEAARTIAELSGLI